MKVSDYNMARCANTIHVVFGIGVRLRERAVIKRAIAQVGFVSCGSSYVSDEGAGATIYEYELKEEAGSAPERPPGT
jgi:hypothetical protein